MQTNALFAVFEGLILIFSIVIHEVSHGYMAERLGDPTARLAGRLTLNPLVHIDPLGSIILPLLTFFTTGTVFGWAKPVPYNPYNLRNGRRGELMVAFAGPLSNLSIAVIFSILIRIGTAYGTFGDSAIQIFAVVVLVNIALAIFNLIPIPPLDGSKILFSLLPLHYSGIRTFLERYSLILIIGLLFFWSSISIVAVYVFQLLTGISLF